MNAPVALTSSDNPKIKALLKLKRARGRKQSGQMLIEGVRELTRALAAGYRPSSYFVCEAIAEPEAWAPALREAVAAGPTYTVTEALLRKIAYREQPEALLATGPLPSNRLDMIDATNHGLVLVADRIEKPGNLGAMLRTLDGASADGLLVSDGVGDLGNPNLVRASLGALFAVPTATGDAAGVITALRARDIRIVVADPEATVLYWDCDYGPATALVVGSEAHGVQKQWLAAADERVRIPMLGQGDSLNAATAAALLVYEALRQRRTQPDGKSVR